MNCAPNDASSLATRRSHDSAIASPPPTAAPCTAAITGCGSSWIASMSWARLSWMKWIDPDRTAVLRFRLG